MTYFVSVFLPFIMFGLFSLFMLESFWLAFFFWILISGLGIATTYHRILSHRALRLPRWLEYITTCFGLLGAQGSAISWVAVHRGVHHPHADTTEDYHTPRKGWWNAFIGWTSTTEKTLKLSGAGIHLLRDRFHRFTHLYYVHILYISTGLLFLISPVVAFSYGVAVLISLLQENSVNLFCHLRPMGYRNYETGDDSINNVVLGYLCWGQGWHNNHHYSPQAFNFQHKWWELDLTMIFYPLLKVLECKRNI